MRRESGMKRALAAAFIAMFLAGMQAKAAQGAPEDPGADRLMQLGGFLDSHPDLRNRALGVEHYRNGRYEAALRFFKRAARHADKYSQAMVAEMLWNGQGVAMDRALAYAWMDVAAERGYRRLATQRERYWSGLDEAERGRALEVGRDVHAEYGDEVAKPRMAAVLRRAASRMTGSRLGTSAAGRSMEVWIPGPGGAVATTAGDANLHIVSAAEFYDPQFWDPERYQAWHDAVWKWVDENTGRVDVGEPESVGGQAAD